VIRDIARAEGMTQLARELNLSQENRYRSFSKTGNPSFTTVVTPLDFLGYRIKGKQKAA
jgi:probable addiction module antidote protein